MEDETLKEKRRVAIKRIEREKERKRRNDERK